VDLHKYIEDYAFDGFKERYPEVIEYLKYSSEFFAVTRGLCGDKMNDGIYYFTASRLSDINMIVMKARMSLEDYEKFITELDRLIKLEHMLNEDAEKTFKPQHLLVENEDGTQEVITVIEVEDDEPVKDDEEELPESFDWDLKSLEEFRR